MIRVLLADDHPIVREGLKQILAGAADMEVAGEAGSGDELLALAGEVPADVLLLDISMPQFRFLDALRLLATDHPSLRTLVLSVHSEDLYAVRAFQGGAWGYLSKENTPEELVKAIRQIHGGHRYVTQSLAERLALQLVPETDDPPHDRLSNREYEVLLQLAEGKQVKRIAADLGLSSKTISTYRTRILEKMGLETNADLVRYAIERKLLDA